VHEAKRDWGRCPENGPAVFRNFRIFIDGWHFSFSASSASRRNTTSGTKCSFDLAEPMASVLFAAERLVRDHHASPLNTPILSKHTVAPQRRDFYCHIVPFCSREGKRCQRVMPLASSVSSTTISYPSTRDTYPRLRSPTRYLMTRNVSKPKSTTP
jgi:hypothetical protein